MNRSTHVNGYSLALYTLALEENALNKYKEECQAIISALEQNRKYWHLVNQKSIDLSERITLIMSAFKKASKNIKNFLCILVQRSKFQYAKPILVKLNSLLNEQLGINEGEIYTPTLLKPKELADITNRVGHVFKLKKLTLINKIDSELVIGFRVLVNGEVIEDSMMSRIEQIRSELLKGETSGN